MCLFFFYHTKEKLLHKTKKAPNKKASNKKAPYTTPKRWGRSNWEAAVSSLGFTQRTRRHYSNKPTAQNLQTIFRIFAYLLEQQTQIQSQKHSESYLCWNHALLPPTSSKIRHRSCRGSLSSAAKLSLQSDLICSYPW